MWKKLGEASIGLRANGVVEKVVNNRTVYQFVTYLLALRHFKPSFVVRSEIKLSTALKTWAVAVFKDYGVKKEKLLGSVTDNGGDIKRTRSLLGSYWEWCICHLLNNAAQEAFGLKKQVAEVETVSLLVSRIIKTVYLVKNKSSAGTLFMELSNDNKLLITFQRHRFLGIYEVMVRIIEKWTALELFFDQLYQAGDEEAYFPLSNDYQSIYGLTCILAPLSKICKLAQAKDVPQGYMIVDLMHVVKTSLGNTSQEILDYKNPKRKFGFGSDLVIEVRNNLIKALDNRFFVPRYIQVVKAENQYRSVVFDLQLYLTPGMSKLDGMREVIRQHCRTTGVGDADRIVERNIKRIENLITNMALEVSYNFKYP